MDSPDTWRWIWLVASAAFLVGELATPGTFFLAAFAVGAAAAALLSFLGVGAGVAFVVFLVGSGVAFAALFPLRRRIEAATPQPDIGVERLVGQVGRVLRELPEADAGLVRVCGEEWRAESLDGQAIPEGAVVRVSRVRSNRVIVRPVDELALKPWELP